MKAGFIGLVGLPNSGKSTLVNALVGEKVAIVSSKPQTTRKRVLGILNTDEAQLIFVDAPGKVMDQRGLNAYLKRELTSVILESDVLVAVLNIDLKNPKYLEDIIKEVKASGKPWVAVITKDDLPFPQRTMSLRSRLKDEGVPVIAVSAVRKKEVLAELLLPLLLERLPASEAELFPKDIYTTQSEKEIIAETLREKCFQWLHEELPFGLATKVMEYEEKNNTIYCSADIVVAKPSHVSIVIGKGAQSLKNIGTLARTECEKILGKKVVLKTFVKCDEAWSTKPSKLLEFGYAD